MRVFQRNGVVAGTGGRDKRFFITNFFKMREITMCLLASGNSPVERKRSDGAGE